MNLTYDKIVQQAYEAIPEFKEKYEEIKRQDLIFDDTGPYIVFSYVFNPLFVKEVEENNENLIHRLSAFLEEMSTSEDHLVSELCDIGCLEELHDNIKDHVLYPLLGEDTKKGFVAISMYMYKNE